MNTYFKSSMGRSMLYSTLIISSLLFFAIYKMIYNILITNNLMFSFYVSLSILIFILLSIIYAFCSQIKGISVTDDSLIIQKRLGQIIISRKDIISAQVKKQISCDLRLCGISGLFGHIGLFWNKSLGRYTAYVSNGDHMIELKLNNKSYVVSCDKNKELINMLNATEQPN